MDDVHLSQFYIIKKQTVLSSNVSFQISKEKIQYLTNRNVVIQAWLDRGIK